MLYQKLLMGSAGNSGSGFGVFAALVSNFSGSQVAFMTSTNGTTWNITQPAALQGNKHPQASGGYSQYMCAGGGKLIVSFGNGGTGFFYTTDLVNWTPITNSPWNGTAYSPQHIAYSPTLNLWVASGDGYYDNHSATSTDGINWTSRTNPAGYGGMIMWWSAGNRFLATTSNTSTQLKSSTDGINWSNFGTAAPTYYGFRWWIANNLIFVTGSHGAGQGNGTYANSACSSDGNTWVMVKNTSGSDWPGSGSNNTAGGAAGYINGNYVLTGEGPTTNLIVSSSPLTVNSWTPYDSTTASAAAFYTAFPQSQQVGSGPSLNASANGIMLVGGWNRPGGQGAQGPGGIQNYSIVKTTDGVNWSSSWDSYSLASSWGTSADQTTLAALKII